MVAILVAGAAFHLDQAQGFQLGQSLQHLPTAAAQLAAQLKKGHGAVPLRGNLTGQSHIDGQSGRADHGAEAVQDALIQP